jgi:hypothetical protein
MDMAVITTNAGIVRPCAPTAQLSSEPPKPRKRKARTGEFNRLVHRAIDRRDIDLVDAIADEVAKDHPEILLPNAFGDSVRDALELRRGQMARELAWWL